MSLQVKKLTAGSRAIGRSAHGETLEFVVVSRTKHYVTLRNETGQLHRTLLRRDQHGSEWALLFVRKPSRIVVSPCD